VEEYKGDREVLDIPKFEDTVNFSDDEPEINEIKNVEGSLSTTRAPKPVGAYPHARKVGNLLYLSGVGPRQAKSNAIPGGPIRNLEGEPLNYDMRAQTIACIENIKTILEDSGSCLEDIVDVTSFLINMQRDFKDYNEIYADYFGEIKPTRTTLEIRGLPTPIAVEMKVIAKLKD